MSNAFWQWGEMRAAGRLSTRSQRGNGGQMNPSAGYSLGKILSEIQKIYIIIKRIKEHFKFSYKILNKILIKSFHKLYKYFFLYYLTYFERFLWNRIISLLNVNYIYFFKCTLLRVRQMAYVLMAFEFGQIWNRLRRRHCHFACSACPTEGPPSAGKWRPGIWEPRGLKAGQMLGQSRVSFAFRIKSVENDTHPSTIDFFSPFGFWFLGARNKITSI